MVAASPSIAHAMRLTQQKITAAQGRPRGHYDHHPFQWGYVHAIHPGPPLTVDLYLDGSQNTNDTGYLTLGVMCLAGYVPTVGDVVLVRRGQGMSASDRVVLGKLNGATSPYPLPLGGINSSGQYVQGPNALWGGAGAPPSSLGTTGDYYFRTDTPGTTGQRLYVRTSTGWVATSL